jgi:hypothetical protein
MKVFGCKNDYDWGGGLILVAANSKEEAYLTAAYDDKTSYLFDWADDDYIGVNLMGISIIARQKPILLVSGLRWNTYSLI